MIAAGAKGFAIVANDTRAIAPAVKKARDAGLMVVALDLPLDPPELADATFATDNFKAGEIIGQWAAKTLGPSAKNAKIAMLDLTVSPVTVDYLRDHGFLKGFGIPYKDLTKNGSEGADPRIIGHAVTGGEDAGGRTAMENLLQKDLSVNVVYTMDEEVASGLWIRRLRRPARRKVFLSSPSTAAAQASKISRMARSEPRPSNTPC